MSLHTNNRWNYYLLFTVDQSKKAGNKMFYSIFSVSSFYRIAPARLTTQRNSFRNLKLDKHTQRIHTFTVQYIQYVLPNLKAKFKMARRGVNQFGWFASVRGPEKPLNTSFSKRECWSTARKWIKKKLLTEINQHVRTLPTSVWPRDLLQRPSAR